jgi:hypothetical protein
MAEDPLGLPELREVIHRLHEQSRHPDEQMLSPDDITSIAHHLYQGTNDGTRMTNPGYWSHLARTRDFNTQDLDPISAQIRQKQWQGWTGPGWSPEERAALGRDPDGFELSPGDRTSHQWMRDSQYLHDILGRRGEQQSHPTESFFTDLANPRAWEGEEPTEEDKQNQRIQDALDWYKRGANATRSVDGSANFRQYGGLKGTLGAVDNDDYGFGTYNHTISSPLGWAMQRQTMRDPTSKDPEWVNKLRTSEPDPVIAELSPLAGLGQRLASGIIPPAYDFFKNALRSDNHPTPPTNASTTPELLDHLNKNVRSDAGDAVEVARAAQFNRHSPPVPSGMSPEDRVRFILDARKKWYAAQNMNFHDYHYAKTGQLPSKLGSMTASVTADSEDLSTPILGAMGGAMGALGGKGASTYAKMAGEFSEEILPGFAINALTDWMPISKHPDTKPVPFKNYLTPGNAARTDIPHEEHDVRMKRIQDEEVARTQAIEDLRKANRSVPRPMNKPAWNMNSGFKT